MKLSTRRTIRGWLLDLPDKTGLAVGLSFTGLLVLGGVTSTDVVFGVGLLGLLGTIYLSGNVYSDACPNCRSEVIVTSERYCSTCGARLDEVEAAPPVDERVEERYRPLGLEEIERSPPVDAIADGGEYEDGDDSGGKR